jgi:hypothetical protein
VVSLELVGEGFEVRTRVECDLTTVSRVDRRLGLIINLGRHTGKTQSLRNKIATFDQYPTETISVAFECFNEYTWAVPYHKFPKEDLVQKFYQGSPWRQGRSSMHRREDLSSSLRRLKLSLYSRRSRTMTRGRRPEAYFRFHPQGTSKESCKSIHS